MTEQCKRAACHRREEQMLARIAELKAELAEQCRLHGIGSEREAKQLTRIAELEADNHKIICHILNGRLDISAMNCVTQMREQLAAHEAVIKQMREALEELHYCSSSHVADDAYYKAIASKPTTEHLDAYIKGLLGEPVAWRFSDNFGEHYTDDKRDWYDGVNIESVRGSQ